MNKFKTHGMNSVQAEGMQHAAEIFALRWARRQYGKRGDARTCVQGSYSRDGSLAEYQAFIGITKGNETTGHNIHFTVYRV